MTLKELYAQVRGKRTAGQLGKYQLLARHERQLAKYATTMGEGAIKVMIRVFESGYVLYEEDNKFAVFHLDDICGKNDVGCFLSKAQNVLIPQAGGEFHNARNREPE